MSKQPYLKIWNTAYIFLFITWCIAVYAACVGGSLASWNRLPEIFTKLNDKSSLVTILMPILSLVLTGIISSDNKARLVFWRWTHALPGHRAFSVSVKLDSRIDVSKLKQKIGPFPRNPVEQNSKWYSLYRKYNEAIPVMHSHRHYLATRDMCSIAFTFMVVGFLGIALLNHSINTAAKYLVIMLVHYFILALVAQNYGRRFVSNVLVECAQDDSTTDNIGDK